MPKNRLFTILVLLVSIVMLPSCASKPAFELPKFLAPKTPTLTATSTATPLPAYKTFTPTFTPMATDTPSPTPTPALALNHVHFLKIVPVCWIFRAIYLNRWDQEIHTMLIFHSTSRYLFAQPG